MFTNKNVWVLQPACLVLFKRRQIQLLLTAFFPPLLSSYSIVAYFAFFRDGGKNSVRVLSKYNIYIGEVSFYLKKKKEKSLCFVGLFMWFVSDWFKTNQDKKGLDQPKKIYQYRCNCSHCVLIHRLKILQVYQMRLVLQGYHKVFFSISAFRLQLRQYWVYWSSFKERVWREK